MTLEEVLEAYGRLRNSAAKDLELGGLSDLELASIRWTVVDGDPLDAIDGLAPTSGWLRYQSELVTDGSNGWRPLGADAGRLLYGEVVNGSRSLLIRPDGRGGLRMILCERGSGEPHLVEVVSLLGDHGRGRQVYEVYHADRGEGVEAVGARLVEGG